ncbi:MAG: hypothetical protein SynsKO_20910 [Synoicihabitans sp.]
MDSVSWGQLVCAGVALLIWLRNILSKLAFNFFNYSMRGLRLLVYLVVFLVLAVGSLTFCWQTWQEYERLREVARVTAERLLVAEQRLSDQREQLRRLHEDPAYVELVIRRRLGYAKPDEMVFRFEDQ